MSGSHRRTPHGSGTLLVTQLVRRRRVLIELLGGIVFLSLIYVLISSPADLAIEFLPSTFAHSDAGDTGIVLPLINIIQPPHQLSQDIHTCAEACVGRTVPRSVSLQALSGTAPSDDEVDEAVRAAFGDPISYSELYPEDWPFLMHQTDQFSLQSIISLHLQVIAAAHPTSIDSADYLFLNLDTRAIARCFSTCRHRDALPPSLGITDLKHQVNEWVLDTVHEHRGRRRCPSLILSLALIDHDYETNILSQQAQEVLKDEVVVLGIERAPWVTEDRLAAFEQMPYPSTMHLALQPAAREARLGKLGEWQLQQERKFLISFGGKQEPNSPNCGQGPHNGFALRRVITETLLAHIKSATDISLHFFTPRSSRSDLAATHTAMAQSTFCLQPPGDSPTRKGFFDSILLGCIPVIFRRGTYERVWQGQVELEELAVVVDEKDLLDGVGGDVVERLRQVGEEEIKRKREEMAMVAERVQYALPTNAKELWKVGAGWTDDAVGMMLRQLVPLKDKANL